MAQRNLTAARGRRQRNQQEGDDDPQERAVDCGEVVDLEASINSSVLCPALDLNALPEEVFLKLLVLGDLGVGKTALVKRYTGEGEGGGPSLATGVGGNCNSADYKVSVGTNFSVKRVELDGKLVNIQLWDVPGHERFGGMTRTFYKYAHGALIVFDLSRPETFESALSWLSDVTEKLFDERHAAEGRAIASADSEGRQKVSSPSLDEANGAMPVVLLANKCDLPDLKVPRHKYSTYVRENGLLAWYETSAADYANTALAVRRLVEYVLDTDPSLRIARENANIWKQ